MRTITFLTIALLTGAELTAGLKTGRSIGTGRSIQRVATGPAALSGRVVSDEATPSSLRGAIVTLNSVDGVVARSTSTDETGRFVFRELPASRYLVSASKSAYVTMTYGATRAGRAGTPVVVNDATASVTIRLPRGAVITGIVQDETGAAVWGTPVHVLQYRWQNGQRILGAPRGMSTEPMVLTDDRGMYRLYGLPAGEYVVATVPGLGTPLASGGARDMSGADLQRAARALQNAPPIQIKAIPGRGFPAATPSPVLGYAPIYYPGVGDAAAAGVVTVGTGEERRGVDLRFTLVPVFPLTGTIVAPPGVAANAAVISIVPTGAAIPAQGFGIGSAIHGYGSTRPDADGRYTLTGLRPGRFTVTARTTASGNTPLHYAMERLEVDGSSAPSIDFHLRPAMTIQGRLDAEALPAERRGDVRVMLSPLDAPAGATIAVPPATVQADGRFTLTGVIPGRYLLTAAPPAGWALHSADLGGREVLDAGLEIAADRAAETLTVRLTNAPGELSGVLQDTAGRAAPDYFIIVFSAEARHWTWQSRRVQAVRPGTSGRYVVPNLPAGDYMLAAVTDVEANEWFESSFLTSLVQGAIRLTLKDGERRIQDVRVKR